MFKDNLVNFCVEYLMSEQALKVAKMADELEHDRTFVCLVDRWADAQRKQERNQQRVLWDVINEHEQDPREFAFDCEMFSENEVNASDVIFAVLDEVYHIW